MCSALQITPTPSLVLLPALFMSLLFYASGSPPSPAADTKAKADAGFTIHYQGHFGGEQVLSITPSALKCYSKATGLTTTAQAPAWTVRVSHERSRQYFETSCDKFEQPASVRAFNFYRVDLSDGTWHPVRKFSLKGIPACEMHLEKKPSHSNESGRFAQFTGIKEAVYITSNDFKMPEREQGLLNKLFVCAPMPGIPLDLKTTSLTGSKRDVLSVVSVEPYTYNARDFAFPSGFARVASGKFLGGDGLEDLSDVTEFWDTRKGQKDAAKGH
jgi:hypothetical protein